MFRKKEEIQVRNVEHVREGKGTVTFNDFLLPEEVPGHGRVFSVFVLPEGASIGYHDHIGECEAYYILKGEALVNDNGTEIHMKAGDMHLCPDGCGHAIENCGSGETEVLALVLTTL